MTNFAYNRNIPFSTNSPAADQPNMLTNTNSTYSLIDVDHNSFEVNDGGYHKVIHFATQGGDPGAVAGIGQLYTKTLTIGNTDQCLFFESGGGRITQLTGILGGAGNQTKAAVNGYTPLIGGIILQWGEITADASGITDVFFVTSNINFPTTCFTVMAGLRQGSVSTSIVVPGITSINTTKFRLVTTPTRTDKYVWYAIGN